MTLRAAVIKHTYFISTVILVLACLLLLGYMLIQAADYKHFMEWLPGKNDSSLVIWRLCLYVSVFSFWKTGIRYYVSKRKASIKPTRLRALFNLRYRLLLIIVCYELLIVQNLIGKLIGGWV